MNISAIELQEINPECLPHIGPKCPHCDIRSELKPASYIYPHLTFIKHKMFWVCQNYPTCNSYVGTHSRLPWLNFPMGSLANHELREARLKAHHLFDHFWKTGLADRGEMYQWFQQIIKLDEEYAHIGELNLKQCNDLIWHLNNRY